MKAEVPTGKPGIFPFVRHGEDILAVKMTPTEVAASLAAGRGRGKSRIPFEPVVHDVIVKLFTPQHPGKGLTLDRFEFARHPRGGNPVVELVRGLDFTGEYTVKIISQCGAEVQFS